MRKQCRRGYFGIGVYNLQKEVNLGTLWRSAYCLGAGYIFIIGGKYGHQASDTPKSWQHIPLFRYNDWRDCKKHRPHGCQMVAVEITDDARDLSEFCHPDVCAYLLGPENGSLPRHILEECQAVVKIPTKQCLNVSTTGALVAYDRMTKRSQLDVMVKNSRFPSHETDSVV